MKNKRIWIILAVIVVFSLLIRIFRLGIDSPTIYADEAGGHYQALQTLVEPSSVGRTLYNYVQNGTATFTWFLGLTPLGVRLPTAIYGTLVVLLSFFFVYYLGGKTRESQILALTTTFITAISPWNYMLSRIGHPHLLLMLIFLLLSQIFYLRSKSKRDSWVSLIFLLFAAYEYPSMVFIAPLVALFIISKIISKKIIVPSLITLGLTAILFIFAYHGLSSSSRLFSLAIWNDINVTSENNLYRGIAGESTLTKVFYNFPTSVIGVFTKNYLSFFSPDFLFLKGDPILRHSTGQTGVFLLVFLPFLIYGAFQFFKNPKQKYRNYFLLWILLSPIPAAVTNDGAGYLLRVVTMMPFLTYFVALGFIRSLDIFKNTLFKTSFLLFIVAITIFSTGSFLYGYFKVFPAISAAHWEYGFKEISDFQAANPDKMLVIWEDKYPVWYFCFWQKLPGSVCDQYKINISETIDDTRIDLPIENLLFSLPKNEYDFDQILIKHKPKYVAIPQKYSLDFPEFTNKSKVVQDILYPDKSIAFEIYQVNK